jgi:transcription-repair coupling factor (superfamily II helicase)
MRFQPATNYLLACFLSNAAVKGFISSSYPRLSSSSLTTTTRLLEGRSDGRSDIQRDRKIVFGSSEAEEDDDGAIDEDVEYDRQQQERKLAVAKLLEQQDAEFKEDRRKKKWGEFADATSKEDIVKVEQKMKERIALENVRKANLAKRQGVELEVLEAQDSGIVEDNGNIRISAGSTSPGYFDKMDEDLQQEWEDMESGNEKIADGGKGQTPDTVEVNGKIVSRDALQGVRVGSAGGWSLEIFPGDFVVHRKYGIGRFERTCLRPKSKLTEEEQEARDARRVTLLTQELKKIKGATSDQIQEIRSKFGTDEDTDVVSNPQATVLEVTYADGIVHVPVDRAYRISRYRAGDAVVKPRLSRVRGEAWKKARRKVEENTIQLAQDVLALYATRETLQRQPFDPAKEDEIKTFGETFKFEPTVDQKKCFEDVENDMVWRSRPMDRLICGDVGFGKTGKNELSRYQRIA